MSDRWLIRFEESQSGLIEAVVGYVDSGEPIFNVELTSAVLELLRQQLAADRGETSPNSLSENPQFEQEGDQVVLNNFISALATALDIAGLPSITLEIIS